VPSRAEIAPHVLGLSPTKSAPLTIHKQKKHGELEIWKKTEHSKPASLLYYYKKASSGATQQ
jgi:hypothetical protein